MLFPSFFHAFTPGQLVAGLKSLGFHEVHEGAFGARMIATAYTDQISTTTKPLIASHCPAVVDLVERHYPSLVPNLIPVVSPMIAMGRFIKQTLGTNAKVVYVSTCIAAKFEVQPQAECDDVDIVLTYAELELLFKRRGIAPEHLAEAGFDGINPHQGRMFTLAGGPSKRLILALIFLTLRPSALKGAIHT